MGNEVTVPENPQRVIGSYLEDYLVALGGNTGCSMDRRQ